MVNSWVRVRQIVAMCVWVSEGRLTADELPQLPQKQFPWQYCWSNQRLSISAVWHQGLKACLLSRNTHMQEVVCEWYTSEFIGRGHGYEDITTTESKYDKKNKTKKHRIGEDALQSVLQRCVVERYHRWQLKQTRHIHREAGGNLVKLKFILIRATNETWGKTSNLSAILIRFVFCYSILAILAGPGCEPKSTHGLKLL